MPDPTPSLGSDVPAHRAVLARLRTALGRLADATNAADVAREQAARVPANPAEWGEVYATAEQAVRDADAALGDLTAVRDRTDALRR